MNRSTPSSLPHDPERLDRRKWLAPDDSLQDVDTSWRHFQHRETRLRRSRTRRRWVAVGLASAAAAVLVWFGVPDRRPTPWAGTALESGTEPLRVALADGSVVNAESHTKLRLLDSGRDELRLSLRRGTATFEVAHKPRRRFIVRAGRVEVTVIGTKFRVSRRSTGRSERTSVSVERGIVEVRGGGTVRRLRAGQSWEATEETRDHSEPRAPELSPPTPTPPPSVPAPAVSQDSAGSKRQARPRPATAATLFEEGTTARRAGNAAAAARSYEKILRSFPQDPRAHLAAVELGRLKMDRLNDARGAARAFEFALRNGRRSALSEDAMGRLVQLYDQMGRADRCRRAKRKYLAAFPAGRYAQAVSRACP